MNRQSIDPATRTKVADWDRTRLLPATDPFSRQITVGCGAFLELLRMAAAQQGFRAEMTYFPSGEWPAAAVGDTPICQITFVSDPQVQRDPLFAHVLSRRTNRGSYDAPMSSGEAEQMRSAVSTLPVTFGWTSEAALMNRLRDIARRGWEVETMKDETYFESVRVFRLTGTDILKHRDGLSFHGPFFWWLNRLGLFTQERALAGDSMLRQQTLDYIIGQLGHTPSFAWIITHANDRLTQLASGAAYARLNLQATALGLSTGPLSQVLQEFPEMLPLLAEHKRILGVPEGDTVQMFFRVGHAVPGEPAPRRPLDDILRT